MTNRRAPARDNAQSGRAANAAVSCVMHKILCFRLCSLLSACLAQSLLRRTSSAFSSCTSLVAPCGSVTSTSGSMPIPSMQRPLGV